MNRPYSMGLAEGFRPSMQEVEIPIPIPRYLCLSNGYEVFCLDLHDRKDQSISRGRDAPPLARIGTIDLLDDGLPAIMGFMKLGADAYIIGGQDFSASLGGPDHVPYIMPESDVKTAPVYVPEYNDGWTITPIDRSRGIGRYISYCAKYEIKSSSRNMYALSLVEDALRLCGDNLVLPLLKGPKIWPIFEEINGETHLIDSVPNNFATYCYEWDYFSHEVLSHDRRSWEQVSTVEIVGYITSHTVVGRRIYAVTYRYNLVFDSETRVWEEPQRRMRWLDPFSVKDVWHILDRGFGRCVNVGGGGFAYGDPTNPLYVLIAVVQDFRYHNENWTHALAYLVTSMGRVVCFQQVPDFFKGPVKPIFIQSGTMIKVDDEGKTLCSILCANAAGPGPPYEVVDSQVYVFINTLTVEWLDEGESKVRELLAKGREAKPVELDFVRVNINHSYLYADRYDDCYSSHGIKAGVQACFL